MVSNESTRLFLLIIASLLLFCSPSFTFFIRYSMSGGGKLRRAGQIWPTSCLFFGFLKFYSIEFSKKLLIFRWVGSSLLRAGFLQLWRAGATLRCSARTSHCSGFSRCGAWALDARASVVVAQGLSSCDARA